MLVWCYGKRRQMALYNKNTERSYIEINLKNLEHNVNVLKDVMPEKCELMAVVKAEAYGHGLFEIAEFLNKVGIKTFATATIEEAICLRQYGVVGEILILGYTAPERAEELLKYNLIQTLIGYDYALRLSGQGYDIKTHLKIDTGMHRLGFDKDDMENIMDVFSMKHINVCGVFTHLCCADSLAEEDICFTKKQIKEFYKLLDILKEKGIEFPKIHIQSSYGLLNYPELRCDYIRAGIVLYGVLSSANDRTKLQIDLKPVLSLRTKIILLRRIKKGECVGYSRAFTAERDSLIAMLPIGYADGIPRNLSYGKNYVLVNGQKALIIGRICMDQLAIDVTDILDVKVGMTVTLIGKDGEEEIKITDMAENAESITNELLSRMGPRLKIVTMDKPER